MFPNYFKEYLKILLLALKNCGYVSRGKIVRYDNIQLGLDDSRRVVSRRIGDDRQSTRNVLLEIGQKARPNFNWSPAEIRMLE